MFLSKRKDTNKYPRKLKISIGGISSRYVNVSSYDDEKAVRKSYSDNKKVKITTLK